MDKIYDIYDKYTFRLVKGNVTLGKRKNTHKDLTEFRYLKIRIGTEPEAIDHDALIHYMHNMHAKLLEMEATLANKDDIPVFGPTKPWDGTEGEKFVGIKPIPTETKDSIAKFRNDLKKILDHMHKVLGEENANS